MSKLKEKVYFTKEAEGYALLLELQKMQNDLDKKKKELRELTAAVRSKAQLIPNKLRKWEK